MLTPKPLPASLKIRINVVGVEMRRCRLDAVAFYRRQGLVTVLCG